MPLAFVDCETTHLDAEIGVAWEVAVILREFEGGHHTDTEYVWQIRPSLATADREALQIGRYLERFAVPPHAEAAYTGDGSEALVAMTRAEVVTAITSLLSGTVVIGSNPGFDDRHLRRLLGPGRAQWHYRPYDIVQLAAARTGLEAAGPLPWSSRTLSRTLGVEPPADDVAHTALGDARWVRDLYDAARTQVVRPHAELRDLVAGTLYAHWNRGRTWADAHPHDRVAYGADADAAIRALAAAAERPYAVAVRADIYREILDRLHLYADTREAQVGGIDAVLSCVSAWTEQAGRIITDAVSRAAGVRQAGFALTPDTQPEVEIPDLCRTVVDDEPVSVSGLPGQDPDLVQEIVRAARRRYEARSCECGGTVTHPECPVHALGVSAADACRTITVDVGLAAAALLALLPTYKAAMLHEAANAVAQHTGDPAAMLHSLAAEAEQPEPRTPDAFARRELYATAVSRWDRDPEQHLYVQCADAVLKVADAEQARLRRERDLAVDLVDEVRVLVASPEEARAVVGRLQRLLARPADPARLGPELLDHNGPGITDESGSVE